MEQKLQELAPTFFRILTEGIQLAQQKVDNKEGVFYNDIRKEKEDELLPFRKMGLPPGISDIYLSKMLIRDMYYFNADFTQYSVYPLEGYLKWSDLMNTMYKDYKFNENLEMEPVTAPVLNFNEHSKMLFRKEFSENDEDIKEFELKYERFGSMYLDQQSALPQCIFSSLMRSGNSFFRKTIESCLGICTGSNLSNQISLNFALMAQGLKGEQVIDNRVQIIKTHYPYMYPFTTSFTGSTAIVILRNPLDVIMSLFQMAMTISHNRTLANDIHSEFKEEWEYAVKMYADLWNKFYGYWLEQANTKQIPTLFIRFEDMVTQKQQVMTESIEFLYGQENLDGTYIQKRIDNILNKSHASTLYKPRKGGMNTNVQNYTPEQLKYVSENCKELINLFGYSSWEGQEEHSYGFFEYSDLTDAEKEKFNGFKQINKEQKAWYISDKENLDKKTLSVNNKGEGIFIAESDEPLLRFRESRLKVAISK